MPRTPTFRLLASSLALSLCAALSAPAWQDAKKPTAPDDKKPSAENREAVMEALQDVQEVVGDWDGLGANADKSKTWEETANVAWKFNKNGRVTLYMTFKDQADKEKGRLFEEGMLAFDVEKKIYRFKAYKAGGDQEVLEFEGKRTKSGVTLDRVNKGKAKDSLDRIDLKILNEGDRLVFSVAKRVGASKTYKPLAQIGMTRKGTSIASRETNGPKCIVTDGAGTMTVSYNGQTYYVCCTGCRDAFLAEPERYIAKLDKKK